MTTSFADGNMPIGGVGFGYPMPPSPGADPMPGMSNAAPAVDPVPALGYSLSLYDDTGTLIAALPDRFDAYWSDLYNRPHELTFKYPASDAICAQFAQPNEVWLYDKAETPRLINKFKFSKVYDVMTESQTYRQCDMVDGMKAAADAFLERDQTLGSATGKPARISLGTWFGYYAARAGVNHAGVDPVRDGDLHQTRILKPISFARLIGKVIRRTSSKYLRVVYDCNANALAIKENTEEAPASQYIRYAANLKGINRCVDYSGICTRVYYYGDGLDPKTRLNTGGDALHDTIAIDGTEVTDGFALMLGCATAWMDLSESVADVPVDIAPSEPRIVYVIGNAETVTGTVVLTGTDSEGTEQTESIALSGATAACGALLFKTVSSINVPSQTVAGEQVQAYTILPSRLSIRGNDVACSGSVTLAGLDADGNVIAETIDLNGTALVNSANTYSAITSVTTPAPPEGIDTWAMAIETVEFLDSAKITTYGLRAKTLEDGTISDREELRAAAQAHLDNNDEPKVSFTVDVANLVVSDPAFTEEQALNLQVGNRTVVVNQGLGIEESVVITGIKRNLGNLLDMTVELDSSPTSLADLFEGMKSDIDDSAKGPLDVLDDGSKYPWLARMFIAADETAVNALPTAHPGLSFRDGDYAFYSTLAATNPLRLRANSAWAEISSVAGNGGFGLWSAANLTALTALIASESIVEPALGHTADNDAYYKLVGGAWVEIGVPVNVTSLPAIPTTGTERKEMDGMFWHAAPGDTAWTLDSFVFTNATGAVGTDENGDTP